MKDRIEKVSWFGKLANVTFLSFGFVYFYEVCFSTMTAIKTKYSNNSTQFHYYYMVF